MLFPPYCQIFPQAHQLWVHNGGRLFRPWVESLDSVLYHTYLTFSCYSTLYEPFVSQFYSHSSVVQYLYQCNIYCRWSIMSVTSTLIFTWRTPFSPPPSPCHTHVYRHHPTLVKPLTIVTLFSHPWSDLHVHVHPPQWSWSNPPIAMDLLCHVCMLTYSLALYIHSCRACSTHSAGPIGLASSPGLLKLAATKSLGRPGDEAIIGLLDRLLLMHCSPMASTVLSSFSFSPAYAKRDLNSAPESNAIISQVCTTCVCIA